MPFDEKKQGVLLSCESLFADSVCAGDFDGENTLVVEKLPGGLGRLLPLLLGRLDGDKLVSFLGDEGFDLPAVGSLLVKLLAQLELELHRLEHRRSLDGPFTVLLRHGHDWGGGGGCHPEHLSDAESGEELVVVLGSGPLVGALHLDHFELEEVWCGGVRRGK